MTPTQHSLPPLHSKSRLILIRMNVLHDDVIRNYFLQRYTIFPTYTKRIQKKYIYQNKRVSLHFVKPFTTAIRTIMKRLNIITLLTAAILFGACGNKQETPQNAPQAMQNEECLICGAKLKYLEHDTMMECVLCHKVEPSKTRCVNGHYVCNECHTSGLDSVIALCLAETSKNPIEILEHEMSQSFCHMHGPEHHVLVGTALLTAYKNAGGEVDLPEALTEMASRGKQVPGGACGYWGACGAAISTGMFVSIVTKNTPLSTDTWHLSNLMTSKALEQVANNGGPRCCKRDSYLSVLTAIDFAEEHLGVKMEKPQVVCSRSQINNQCIGKKCPFSPARK